MSFRLRAAATAVLLTAALVPGQAAPASAAGTAIPWRYATCVQAQLTGLHPDSNLEYFVVTGAATDCAAPAATDLPVGFSLVTYRGRAGLPGRLQGYNVRMFPTVAPGSGWQPTRVDFGALAVERVSGVYGVCAISGPTSMDPQMPLYYYGVRVACVRITVTGDRLTGFTTVMTPLAADDPSVSGPVSQRSPYNGSKSPGEPDGSPGGDPDNFCGSCF